MAEKFPKKYRRALYWYYGNNISMEHMDIATLKEIYNMYIHDFPEKATPSERKAMEDEQQSDNDDG